MVRDYLSEQSLYVMQNQYGLIKIGRSLNPEQRRRALETCEDCRISLVHVRPNEGCREEEFHLRLHQHRLAGEWFDGTEEARGAVQAALAGDTNLSWPFRFDPAGASAWLDGFWARQDQAHVQREIGRSHNRLRDLNRASWVWDAVLWDLHWLMEAGIRPIGSVDRGPDGEVIQRTWVEGQELIVPRFTADLSAALSLWPSFDRPSDWSGSIIDCCKSAIDARRRHWSKRKGMRAASFRPLIAREF